MEYVKNTFSIKDLEHLSGIKAHTIRIWEKRYNLLCPLRSKTNIRSYSLESLQQLLNITLLYHNGYKISKIAELSQKQIQEILLQKIARIDTYEYALQELKMSMLYFNSTAFDAIYKKLTAEQSLFAVFDTVFIPFLQQIGIWWQTNTITPAHEHFICNLIKQKIYVETERITTVEKKTAPVCILYLPENEIHELSLLYTNYYLRSKGYKTLYLGQSVPTQDLEKLTEFYPNSIFVSFFTVKPNKEDIAPYLTTFTNTIKRPLYISGYQTKDILHVELPENTTVYKTPKELFTLLENN